ncbi:MAG: UvrD-helicase domain-containing protein [bacterium]|nr:UvrD-helicase domain-containing protein [bacterium]
MESNLKNLNKEQKQAVIYKQGPVLIIAGAGTGKTAVIAQRVVYLIEKKLAKPEEILALTFTDKAAEEMVERVDDLLSFGYADLWISTFHSFCERILRENGLDIGISTDFKLLDETSAWLLVRQNLNRFKFDYYKQLGNPNKFIQALISHFSRCKDQEIYPDDYLSFAKKQKEDKKRLNEVAETYKTYQDLLLENNCLDFGDLINFCLELFKKRPKILKKYRDKFKYILVDEFQDTNWVQYELVKLLGEPKNNLTVCFDDDQSIYAWRGASYRNVVQFRKDFAKAKEIALINNYRSTQNILDLAYKFIQANNPNRLEFINGINKQLISSSKEKGFIEHLHFKTLDQEIIGVVDKIAEILEKDKTATFSDFAILARTNEGAGNFSRVLEREGLPFQFLALRGMYSKPIILDIISYFKLLDNYHESSAMFRVLNLPFLKISTEDIAKITHYSHKRNRSIYESLSELPAIGGISNDSEKKINLILSLIKKHSELAKEKNVSEIFISFLKDSGYLEYLAKKERREDFDLINQFYEKIRNFETANLDPILKNFMVEMNLELESGEQGKLSFDVETGPDVIKIMTVHAAKGLEFKYVFLANLVDKRFPVDNRKDSIEIPEGLIKDKIPEGDVHLEEERRLFYVGMTRAKRGLFFSSAENYGGIKKKKISRFLAELGFNAGNIESNEVNFNTKERKINKEKEAHEFLLPKYFSFTQFKAFDNCPLQYKFAHILKIPVRGKASFSFGKTIHNALFDFVKLASEQGQKIGFDKLFGIYEKNWIDEWFKDKEQKKEYFEQGKKSLEKFYDDFREEKPEIVKIGDDLALEKDFNLKIGGQTIIGKIDRIDKIGEQIEIIDYKTGAFKEKLEKDDKEQLLLYQIAAEEVFKIEPKKLTYYYLDQGQKISFLGSEKEKQELKEKINSRIEKIKQSKFEPTPGWQCGSCDFRDICESAKK